MAVHIKAVFLALVAMAIVGGAPLFLSSCSSGNDECDGALRKAQQEWDAAVEDAKTCQTDEDCGVVRVDPGFSACGNAVNEQEIEQLESLDDTLVNRLADCGVTLVKPECDDPPEPVCEEQRCVFPPQVGPSFR